MTRFLVFLHFVAVIVWVPLTLLIDAQGKVLGKYYGAKKWDGPEAKALIGRMFNIKM